MARQNLLLAKPGTQRADRRIERGYTVRMALERELATYQQKLEEIKQHAGQFVLIHGEDIVDYFSAYDDALSAGYTHFGLDQFLVNQVSATETVQYITRHVVPAGFAGAA